MKPLIYALLIAVSLYACGESSPRSDEIVIVCTTGMLGDAVSHFTEGCTVHSLMGPGTDPHLFKPTKESLDMLQRADVIVANGLHLEGRMQDILEKLARRKPVIFAGDFAVRAENGADPPDLIYADARGKVPDPHLWFDVALWKKALTHTSAELRKSAPGCTDVAGTEAYFAMLDGLEKSVRNAIAEIPEPQRVLITAHDAFSYFGRAYGMEVAALQGISTAAEYGLRDVTDMIDLITERRIKAIFDESALSPRSVNAVIAGCKSRDFDLKRGGTLYADALGGPDSGADTYEAMVLHNVTTIKNALK